MRVSSYILSTALMAGLAAAQSAPASQTVNNSQQPAKPTTQAKPVIKSPFVPKTKLPSAPQTAKTQTLKSAQAQSGSHAKAPQSQTTSKPKQGSTVQTKAAPNATKPAVTKKQQPEKDLAKKQQLKKPEVKAAPVQAKAEAKPAEPEKKAAPAPPVAQNGPAKLPSPGKRDPFLSPLVAAGARNPSNCTTGKRCLVVDQIVLKGVVQMKNGNLALVENAGKRPYVLHENDSLFNGSVVKITGDSLILREESNDILGRPVSKEVVKKVTAPSV